jgi:hypothetical protein
MEKILKIASDYPNLKPSDPKKFEFKMILKIRPDQIGFKISVR